MTKHDRDHFLIEAITNSIKYQTETDEAKILDMLSDDSLFKEC